MLDNIVGEVRKWQAGSVHWQAKVIEVNSDSAKVQLTSKNGKDKSTTMHVVTWTAGELADHGFDVLYEK